MAKRSKKKALEEVQRSREFALRILGDSREGEILKVLMESPTTNTIADLRNMSNLSRYHVEIAARELIRRGLVTYVENELFDDETVSSGYSFSPLPEFPELQL